MRRRSIGTLALTFALTAALMTPARAEDRAREHGSCSGSGHWRLVVRRASPSTFRVRFVVRDVEPGHVWQVFLSDDDRRIFAGTRAANADGRFRVRLRSRDRSGRDEIEASAIDGETGASCFGGVWF
jgi:hypothetical protein